MPSAKKVPTHNNDGWQRLLRGLRPIHVWVSIPLSFLFLLFAITGILLYHSEELGLSESTSETMVLQLGPVRALSEEALAKRFAERLGFEGTLSDWDPSSRSAYFDYRTPWKYCTGTVDTETGEATCTVGTRSVLQRLMVLHRGESGTLLVALVIDGAAILLSLSSLTGLALALHHNRWRRLTIASFMAGLLFLVLALGMGLV